MRRWKMIEEKVLQELKHNLEASGYKLTQWERNRAAEVIEKFLLLREIIYEEVPV
jgi:hypothetical protein